MMRILDDEIVKVFINCFYIFLALICIILPNDIIVLRFVGIFILTFSIILMLRYRNNKAFTFFIGILTLISVCFSISNCFFPEFYAKNWQVRLVGTESMIICAKNYLLFFAVIGTSFGYIRKDKIVNDIKQEKTNWLIVIAGILAFIFILIFGFDRGIIGTYKPNTNALYEYAIVILIFVLFYNKNKYVKYITLFLSMIYCLQGLLFGDRSSAFPLIICLFLFLYKRDIKIQYVILIGLGGIVLGNAIDVFRNGANLFEFNTWKEVFKSGVHVNTISYSFYGGTQVINYAGVALGKLQHFINYFISVIVGDSSTYNLTVLAKQAGFGNKGGGFSASYFYFWGGYLGTVIGSLVMGRIINKIFNSKAKLSNILAILLISFELRYIMYYPVAFFRTALFVPIVIYILCIHGEVVYKNVIKNHKFSLRLIIDEIIDFWINGLNKLKIKNRKRKKIYIHGSFMNDNFGDYLLYDIILNNCKKINKDNYYFSSGVDYTYDNYNEVNRKSKLYALLFADAVIFAGGGYFGEPSKQKKYWNIRFLYKHLLFAYLLSFTKKDYAILGVEAGPISFNCSKKMMQRFFNNAKVVTVRNEESKKFLEDIGVINKIEVIPDWVLSVENKEIIKYKSNIKNKENKIFLHFTTKPDEQTNKGMINAISDVVKIDKENNYKFFLVCDQKNIDKEKRASDICKKLKDATILEYTGPWDLISNLNEADLIVTDKLHVGIVGVKLGKRVISIACHQKSVKFYKYIDKEENSIFIDDLKENILYKKIKRMLSEEDKINEKYFKDATKNFICLEKFLKEI